MLSMGIRDKLVIIFFALIIIPMFLLWARWQETAIGSTKSVLRRGLAERATEISDQVDLSLQSHQAQAIELTSQPSLRAYARELGLNTQAIPDNLLRIDLSAYLLAHQNVYAALVGVNRLGRPTFKIEARPGPNGVLRPFFESGQFLEIDSLPTIGEAFPDSAEGAKPERPRISEVLRDQDERFVQLMVPMRAEGGGLAGALLIRIRIEKLLAEAAGPRVKPSATGTDYSRPQAIITGPDGQVLYAAEVSRQSRGFAEAFPQLASILTTVRGSKEPVADVEPWFLQLRERTESPRLSLVIVENYSSALSQVEFDSYVLLLLTILLVIVAMLSIYFLISGTTDSIRRVTSGARAIATGNLSYHIEIKSRDETRVLAEAFNRMASRLREMIRKEGEQKQFESFARLSAVLTHDLKNQILSLSLLVSNMERKFDREGFREDALRTLSDSVSNLQNLVSKLSDPRTPTKRIRERSNLTQLVERVLQRTAAQASSRFQISTQLQPELLAMVDGKAIERVIENLVINALEAMPEGGSLMIASRRNQDQAIISIADTGKGMSEEFMRDRLFHPFATTKKKGIGLGLYSCRDIIEQHGGRIDVATQVGLGTEFSIILPLQSKVPYATEPAAPSAAAAVPTSRR
jgi:signal transduction histidine kinase